MRFNLNEGGVREVVNSPKVTAYLNTVGDVVQTTVESQASAFAQTRHFAGSIDQTPVQRGPNGPRKTIFSRDWFAHGIEFGSINNPAYAPFRRAAAALGLKLKGGGERR